MTQLLRQAFDQVSKLPERDQDAMATWVLEELKDEEHWQRAFAGSHDKLSALAAEALSEHRKGRTRTLDPDKL